MSEDAAEPAGNAQPAAMTAPNTAWRAVAIALAGALVVVAALVATAPLWAPLLPWRPPAADQGETRQLGERLDRLAAAQAATRQLGERVDRLTSAQNEMRQHLEQGAAATSAALQRLDQRFAALDAKPPPATAADVAELRQHLAGVSASAAQLGGRIDALAKAMPAAGAPDGRDLAVAAGVAAVRDAVAAGASFGKQYDTLVALARDRPDIADAARPLAAAATQGVASTPALAADGLRLLSGGGTTASPRRKPDTGWTDAMLARLGALVTVRRVDDGAAGAGSPTDLADIRRRLAAGDLAGAVAALDKLSPPPAAVADWLPRARRRLAVDAAVRHLETLAAAHLTTVAPTAPAGSGSGGPR